MNDGCCSTGRGSVPRPAIRYDVLSEIDKAVWDRTHGQTRGADSMSNYHGRLVRAVESGLVNRRRPAERGNGRLGGALLPLLRYRR